MDARPEARLSRFCGYAIRTPRLVGVGSWIVRRRTSPCAVAPIRRLISWSRDLRARPIYVFSLSINLDRSAASP